LEKIPPQTIFEPARTFETIGRIKLAQLVGNEDSANMPVAFGQLRSEIGLVRTPGPALLVLTGQPMQGHS
jgi:hypothetical protein